MGVISAIQDIFLIERATSVFLYAIVIYCTYLYLRQSKSATKFCRVLNTCLVILTVMAFFYVPAESADLYKIRLRIQSMENWSAGYLRLFLRNSSSPGAYLLYFVMSRIKINGLLPALACLVFFGNLFHILKRESILERSGRASLALSFLYIMSQGLFLGVISGIRNAIAFSLVSRALYDDFALGEKKIINYMLCVIAVTFHMAAAPIVAVYLIFSIYDSWKNNRRIMVVVSFFVALLVFLWAFRSGSTLIDSITDKAESYTSGGKYSYGWEYLIVSIALLLLIIVLFKYRIYSKNSSLRTTFLISSIMMVGVVLLFRNYTIFHRYGNFVMYLSLPITAEAIDSKIEQGDYRLYSLVKYGSLLVFALACVRGDLCGYKFFIL